MFSFIAASHRKWRLCPSRQQSASEHLSGNKSPCVLIIFLRTALLISLLSYFFRNATKSSPAEGNVRYNV